MKKLLLVLPLTALVASAASLDLAKRDEITAGYKAILADAAKKPAEKARARYELLKLELLTCEDAEFEAKKKEMLDFIAAPGDLTPREKVEFLYGVVANDDQQIFLPPDLNRLADTASQGDGAARTAYWTRRITARGWGRDYQNFGYQPSKTWECRLALIDEAEKDSLAKFDAKRLATWRLECLRPLGRDAEYEAIVAKTLESCEKASERVTLQLGLADLTRERASRFFAEPHAPTLKKAAALYDKVAETCAGDKRLNGARYHLLSLKSAAECLLAARDFEGARARISALEAATPEKHRPNLDAAMVLGDCAAAERKWEEAVSAYQKAEAKLDLKRKISLGHALFALGRRREALPILEYAAEKGNKYTRLRYRYELEKLRKELGEEK